MKNRLLIPIVLVAAVLIALPAAALTETEVEKDVKEAVGLDLDECAPPTNLASPWVEGPNLAGPRDEPRAVAMGGKIYLVGGTSGIERFGDERHRLVASDQLTLFDPRTGRYRELAPVPQAVNHAGVTAYRGDLYVVGGYGELVDANTHNELYRYDVAADRWSRLPDLPVPRAAGAVGVLDGKLIYAGGARDSVAKSDVFAYDLDSERWSRLAPMHTRREHVGEAIVDGQLYVLGGRAPASLAVDTVERYDPAADRWETLAPLSVPSGGLSGVEEGGKIIAVAGGDDGAETVTSAVQEFDPASGEWSRLPDLRTARHGHGAAVVDDRLWVFGGSDCAYFNATDKVESLHLDQRGQPTSNQVSPPGGAS